jgi:hypothetical protein
MFPLCKSAVLVAALALGAFTTTTAIDRPDSCMACSPAAPAAAAAPLAPAELKRFGKPDEVRTFPKGRIELVKIGGSTIGRAIFEPGWRWSTSVQPLAKTKSCEAPHFQYHVYGVLMVKMDDGTELECKPGDVSFLPAGHDAWVVGDEPAIVVDFHGMVDYAKDKK